MIAFLLVVSVVAEGGGEGYEARREGLPEGDADAAVDLARWCLERGLDREGRREFLRALTIEPRHELALQGLGFTPAHGSWLAPHDRHRISGDRRIVGEWVSPERFWEMRVGEWADALRAGGAAADDALAALAALRDPTAGPPLAAAVGRRGGIHPAFFDALARVGEVPALAPLLLRFFGEDEAAAAAAGDALQRHRERPEIGTALALAVADWLEDPRGRAFRGIRDDPLRRRRWVGLLAAGDAPPSRTGLFHLALADPDDGVRSDAEEILRDGSADWLYEKVSGSIDRAGPISRGRLSLMLGRLGRREAVPLLIDALEAAREDRRERRARENRGDPLHDMGLVDPNRGGGGLPVSRNLPEASALYLLTGESFGEDVNAWRRWWRRREND